MAPLNIVNIVNPIALVVVRVALVVMYILSVTALLTIRGKLRNIKTSEVIAHEVINVKLMKLGIKPKEGRKSRLRLPIWASNGLILGYAVLTALLITYWFVGNALVGIGAVLLSSLIYVMTIETLKTDIEVKREVTFMSSVVAKVKLVIKAPAGLFIRVIDQLWDGAALIKGSSSINYLSDGSEVTTEYIIGIGWGKLNDYLVADIQYPFSVIIKTLKIRPKTEIRYEAPTITPIKGLSKSLSKVLNITEPSVEYVRPYSVGDDLRLIVPKSLTSLGGVRVKVLEKVLEESRELTKPEISLVLSDYVCNYSLGAAQLRDLLLALKYVGIEYVVLSSKSVSIDEVISKLSEFCVEYGGHTIRIGNAVTIVPPDILGNLISLHTSKELNAVITLRPGIDLFISDYVSEWVNSLLKKLSDYVKLLKSRGIDVKVMDFEGISY